MLTPGSRIGAYEIVSAIGAGGMGDVYRARDLRLNRQVAIKVLPDAFAADTERLTRFMREARTLAALNHPNIAQIYGIEESNGIHALVMELVAGDDLSALIARRPLPIADALTIARQIADALDAAHQHGIVHRDLKPANVKVRADGTVKVLDFGIAKATGPDGTRVPADPGDSPTLTAQATPLGVILGTAAYMAPEQARGKVVDRRADIWAFGVVVFEMLTGRCLFEGEEASDVLAAVLRQEIDWARLPADTPASVHRLLRRCLERDPRKRLSAIGDARLEIDDAESSTEPPMPVRAGAWPSLVSRVWPALAAVFMTAAIAYALWPSRTAVPPARLARLSILPPAGERLYPDSASVAVSPDGTMVAFIVGSVARAESELWVRSLDTMVARRVEGGQDANLPFWSPDSRRIGFFTSSKLKIAPASGGRAETLCDAAGRGRGAAWSSSNVIVFAPDGGGPLYRIAASGGTPVPVTTLDAARKEYGHRFPAFLPDGERFLYASLPGKHGRYDIFAGSLHNDSRELIGSMEAAPVFADPGWLLYARQGALVAQAFDPQTLKTSGDPVVLEDEPASILDPAASFTAGRSVSISASGSLAYYSAPSINTVVRWYDATGAPGERLNIPPGHYESVTIAPDGRRAILVKSTSPSESNLWIVDLARGSVSPLSTGRGRNDTPVWSPDGTRVVWAADRDGTQNLFVRTIDDRAPEQPLFTSDVPFKVPAAWSPDNQWIAMTQLDADTSTNVWLLDASGNKPPTVMVRSPGRDHGGPISPDGRWMAYVSEESGRHEVYVQAFPTPGRKVQISERGAVAAWWMRDGRALILLGTDLRDVWRVDVQPGETMVPGAPKQVGTMPADLVRIDAMPDRQRFLAITPERLGTGSVTVVQNWRAALR